MTGMYHGNLKPLMGAHIPGLVAPQLHSLLSRCPPRGEGHSQTVGRSVFIPEDGFGDRGKCFSGGGFRDSLDHVEYVGYVSASGECGGGV
jgi:hypothetical protein